MPAVFVVSGTTRIRLGANSGGGSVSYWDAVTVKEVTGGDLITRGILTGGGTSGIKILPNGNVGIGTTAPNEKLDVNGNIRMHSSVTFIHINQGSAQTVSIATLSSLATTSRAIATFEWCTMYSNTGTGIGHGIKIASTRRGNNDTAWIDIDNENVHYTNSGASEPTFFWDEGVLKITTPGSTPVIGLVKVTNYSCVLTTNIN